MSESGAPRGDEAFGFGVVRRHPATGGWATPPTILSRDDAVASLRRFSQRGVECYLVEIVRRYSDDLPRNGSNDAEPT